MNILYVVPYVPTPIRTRPYNLIRHLARRGHTISLATLWQDAAERAQISQLQGEGIRVLDAHLGTVRSAWNCLRALPTSTPLQAVYCWQPELVRTLKAAGPGARWDLIHVEHLRGARYGLALRSLLEDNHHSLPFVFDSVDCITFLFDQAARNSARPLNRLVTRFELARTRRYEAQLLDQFPQILVTSNVDKQALSELRTQSPAKEEVNIASDPKDSGAARIQVLPNGVDLEHYRPSDQPRDECTIIFTGKMSYHANVTGATHLVNEIMPLVWKERPDARVQIVGKDPGALLKKLAAEPRVSVTGTVPDVAPYLQCAALAVAPMPYGAGIQNKVLEAMACATPVVASPQAVAALDVTPGEHLLVGDSAATFGRHILSLLGDPVTRDRIGRSGRRYVSAGHDWNVITAQLEAIYQETTGSSCAVASGDGL